MMLSVGFDNFVNSHFIGAILPPDSSEARKLRQIANQDQLLINATKGRKTRSIIVMKSNHLILSSLQPNVIKARLKNLKPAEESA
jgi:regulator of extracellular matrix RemA (YlzA/DUF370 family)